MTRECSYAYLKNINPSSQGEMRLQLKGGLNDKIRNEVRKGQYDQLWLHMGHWEECAELAELNPKIEWLNCDFWDPQESIDWISSLENLKKLSIDGKVKGKVDFNQLPKLEEVSVHWCNSVSGLLSSKIQLKSLHIESYKKSLIDFNPSVCNKIKELVLVGGSLKNLRGIENFQALEFLDIADIRNLLDISDIVKCVKLEKVYIESCNKIVEITPLGKVTKLEKLILRNKSINSLSSLLPGKHLKSIGLGEKSKIEDLDIGAALKFPKLEKLSFPNRKGYSHTYKEINEILQNR